MVRLVPGTFRLNTNLVRQKYHESASVCIPLGPLVVLIRKKRPLERVGLRDNRYAILSAPLNGEVVAGFDGLESVLEVVVLLEVPLSVARSISGRPVTKTMHKYAPAGCPGDEWRSQ